MDFLPDLLRPIKVKLDQLLLDPNNPRFAELGIDVKDVPELRFSEPAVQDNCIRKLKEKRFDLVELRDTIKELGFLPMDRIVVRRWNHSKNGDFYVVIEGNRRIAALKWLIEIHQTGREQLIEQQIKNLTELEVLLLEQEADDDLVRLILPGLRHVSGIQEWGPFQKGLTVFKLRESGKSPQEAAQSLGLSTRAANQLWRAFLGLRQMKEDDEYGDFAVPQKYSYFEEIMRQPTVKDWLGWKDEQQKFVNEDRMRKFYSWMIGEPVEENNRSDPKLPEARSVRNLAKILDNKLAMTNFESPDGSIEAALAIVYKNQYKDWKPLIANAREAIANLSPDMLRALTNDEICELKMLSDKVIQALKDRDKLIGT